MAKDGKRTRAARTAGTTDAGGRANRAGVAMSAAGLRLSSLVGGAMGLLGFAVAVLQGLAAGVSVAVIFERAVIAMFLLAIVGGLAGAVAARVIAEAMPRATGTAGPDRPSATGESVAAEAGLDPRLVEAAAEEAGLDAGTDAQGPAEAPTRAAGAGRTGR